MADDLHRGTFMADLLLHALESNLDKPCVYLGDQVLTAREVRDEMSRYSQALAGLGLGKGSPMSVLAPNRPEVLFNMGANIFVGCRTTPLHPLGSLGRPRLRARRRRHRDARLRPAASRSGPPRCATACPGLKRLLCVRPDRARRRLHRARREVRAGAAASRPTSTPTTCPASPTPAAPPASRRA